MEITEIAAISIKSHKNYRGFNSCYRSLAARDNWLPLNHSSLDRFAEIFLEDANGIIRTIDWFIKKYITRMTSWFITITGRMSDRVGIRKNRNAWNKRVRRGISSIANESSGSDEKIAWSRLTKADRRCQWACRSPHRYYYWCWFRSCHRLMECTLDVSISSLR